MTWTGNSNKTQVYEQDSIDGMQLGGESKAMHAHKLQHLLVPWSNGICQSVSIL
jgi:hypothetical protein